MDPIAVIIYSNADDDTDLTAQDVADALAATFRGVTFTVVPSEGGEYRATLPLKEIYE